MCFMFKWIYNILQLVNSFVVEYKIDEDLKMKLWDIFIFIFCLYMFNVIKYGNLKKKRYKNLQ